MDCSICTSMPVMLRPPRNTICLTCYEEARSVISFINKLHIAHGSPDQKPNLYSRKCIKWVHNMNEVSEELNEKIRLLSGFSVALRDKIHTDILLQPGDDGPPVPAHRALLAIRLEIFNNILDLDGCKAPPNDTIKLPELNHEELESLLEFLYHGDLSEEKMNKHIYSLSLAADKYGISYLQKLCERHMHKSLSSANALDVLEVADVCSSLTLRENALEYIVKNMHDIIFSAKYDTFALKNPHLCVQISRASLIMDDKRNSVVRECY
ncbi:unnamed protein product [Malus baccata var. baccata]